MSFSLDRSTETGMVRVLCMDTNPDKYLLEDEDILTILSLEDEVKAAAVECMRMMAAKLATSVGKFKLQDLDVDTSAASKLLMERAAKLEATLDDEPTFDFIEWHNTYFSMVDKIVTDIERDL